MKHLLISILAVILSICTYTYADHHQANEHVDHQHNHHHKESGSKGADSISQTNKNEHSLQEKSPKKYDIRLKTKGIVCSFCAQGAKKALLAHPSVKSLQFDSEFNIIDLTLNKNASISDEEIKQTVKNTGYEVDEIDRPKTKRFYIF